MKLKLYYKVCRDKNVRTWNLNEGLELGPKKVTLLEESFLNNTKFDVSTCQLSFDYQEVVLDDTQ